VPAAASPQEEAAPTLSANNGVSSEVEPIPDAPIEATAPDPAVKASAEVAPGNEEEMDEDESDLDDLAKLKKHWPALVEQINARSKQMAAVFRDQEQVRPYSVSGKVVTISFKAPFYAQRARQDVQRTLVEQVLSRTLGHDCLLEAITFDEEDGASGNGGLPSKPSGPKEKGPKTPAPHETPRGRAAMNIFGIEKFEDQ